MTEFLWLHLDYVAMAVILLGYFRMSALKVDGWVWTCLGSMLLVIFGTLVVPSAMGVAIGNAIFIVVTIRGFIKWRKKLQ
ncbi:hypothetical protein LCGC14_2028690 [marine sediment metagenome]|uniref:Uncharacterized protein n=1 Tax=marine sediment metagenome TaxID=412755 RepID=A0A0F9H8S0_9ZZZZ